VFVKFSFCQPRLEVRLPAFALPERDWP